MTPHAHGDPWHTQERFRVPIMLSLLSVAFGLALVRQHHDLEQATASQKTTRTSLETQRQRKDENRRHLEFIRATYNGRVVDVESAMEHIANNRVELRLLSRRTKRMERVLHELRSLQKQFDEFRRVRDSFRGRLSKLEGLPSPKDHHDGSKMHTGCNQGNGKS